MAKTFAYIRVSTREQNENRQLDSLQGLNIDEIIVEKASGKNFVGREKYQEMKSKLRAGDLIVVKSIDRFGQKNTQGRCFREICKRTFPCHKSQAPLMWQAPSFFRLCLYL